MVSQQNPDDIPKTYDRGFRAQGKMENGSGEGTWIFVLIVPAKRPILRVGGNEIGTEFDRAAHLARRCWNMSLRPRSFYTVDRHDHAGANICLV